MGLHVQHASAPLGDGEHGHPTLCCDSLFGSDGPADLVIFCVDPIAVGPIKVHLSQNGHRLRVSLFLNEVPWGFWQEDHPHHQNQCRHHLESERESPLKLACIRRMEGSVPNPSMYRNGSADSHIPCKPDLAGLFSTYVLTINPTPIICCAIPTINPRDCGWANSAW